MTRLRLPVLIASLLTGGTALAQLPTDPNTPPAPIPPVPPPQPPQPQPVQPQPPQPPPMVVAPQPQPSTDRIRPDGFSIGIGFGYQFPTSLQTPNTTSVRCT